MTFPEFLASVGRLRHQLVACGDERTQVFVRELQGNPVPVFKYHGAKVSHWHLRNTGQTVGWDGIPADARETFAAMRGAGWTDYAIGRELEEPGAVRAMCLRATGQSVQQGVRR